MQGESPPCRLKNHTVVYMITCMLSFRKTDVYNVLQFIILEREGVAVCLERKTQ